jgi:nucleotide-binding universal stress UspA family protein
VLSGDPASRLLEQEEDQDADLIVLGKHGKHWFQDLLLGSTTKHLLSNARSDVLISQKSV